MLSPFGSFKIVPVDEGYRVVSPAGRFIGRVTQESSILYDTTIYITHENYEGLKEELPNLSTLQ